MKGHIEQFLELTKIPRDSKDSKGISKYLMDFAKVRNLDASVDGADNVVIRKPGTAGYENAPIIVLQSHTDMVYIKSPTSNHDYHSPLVVKDDGKFMMAEGTSLGADNGIGMAYALALLDSSDIPHPPLEALFTSDEEIGLIGASNLSPNAIKGRQMINLDSEEEGVFTAGCAGGFTAIITLKATYEANALPCYKVSVSGLLGGHSGVEIDKGRGNAILLIARFARAAVERLGAKVVSFSGGTKMNAIPNAAEAVIAAADGAALKALVAEFQAAFSKELAGSDAGVTLAIADSPKAEKVFSQKSFQDAALLLFGIPNGIQSMNMFLKGLVESSNNIGILRCDDTSITVTCAARSSVSTLKEYIRVKIEMIAGAAGAQVAYEGQYPEWEFSPTSPLLSKAVDVFTRLYGKQPRIEAIHGGLECGYFKSIYPDMDMLSTGPNLYDVHTPEEKMDIQSANNVWDWLVALLKELK